MKSLVILMLALLMLCSSATAAPSTGQQLGQFGLATLGSLAGAVVAITTIAELGPRIESRVGSTALVIGSLTLFDGLGAAAGVLAAGKIWDIDGSIGGSILGGLAGGLASAFVEPLLYVIGIPEGWTEFLGMALLPILPALGATLGFRQ
jgi:hypothetical protein